MFKNTKHQNEPNRETKTLKSSSSQNSSDFGLMQFKDNRVEASNQQNQQNIANSSPQTLQLLAIQKMADRGAVENKLTQLKKTDPTNNTGLPDQLKSGIENLSGMSMDDVKVQYNSAEPAALNALAYAQGSDIHVGPGEEEHLPHEAWHVVQQAQGRVKPTTQLKGNIKINDDSGLEAEADVMGAKALQSPPVEEAKLKDWEGVLSGPKRPFFVTEAPTSMITPTLLWIKIAPRK